MGAMRYFSMVSIFSRSRLRRRWLAFFIRSKNSDRHHISRSYQRRARPDAIEANEKAIAEGGCAFLICILAEVPLCVKISWQSRYTSGKHLSSSRSSRLGKVSCVRRMTGVHSLIVGHEHSGDTPGPIPLVQYRTSRSTTDGISGVVFHLSSSAHCDSQGTFWNRFGFAGSLDAHHYSSHSRQALNFQVPACIV